MRLPQIALCMIAKNEEEMIERALMSAKVICDHLILVDTGSTDKTIDIALKCGAMVYPSILSNPGFNGNVPRHRRHFALWRNEAFGYAEPFADWFLILDADEELVKPQASKQEFQQKLALIPDEIGSLRVNVREWDEGKDRHTGAWQGGRFFRKTAYPHYFQRIHNQFRYDGGMAGTDIYINHYGYHLSKEKMDAKHDRIETSLLERLESDPNDSDAMHYMAQLYLGKYDWENVIYWGEKCLKCHPAKNGQDLGPHGGLYFYLGYSYMVLGNGPRAFACAEKGLQFFPEDIDLHYLMAMVCGNSNNFDEFRSHAKKFLELYKKHTESPYGSADFVNPADESMFHPRGEYVCTQKAHDQITNILEKLDDLENGRQQCPTAL